jgi:TRAP-type C4-dicarboxylate transport system substrate-binding protein
MIMKRRTVLGGLAASTLMMTSKVASAATTTLKYGWFGPATEPTYARSMAPFGERVTNASNALCKSTCIPAVRWGAIPRVR